MIPKTAGSTMFNMTAFTKIHKGGQRMDSEEDQADTAKSDIRTFTRKPIVDWSEDTIVVNGKPITVVFPDEEKVLDDE